MKNTSFIKIGIGILGFLFSITHVYAQPQQWLDFNAPRWNNNGANVKGDFTAIGNNFLTLQSYTENGSNSPGVPMRVIDIDNNQTFYSAATLNIPSVNRQCTSIKWAGLYWVCHNPKAGAENLHWVTPDGVERHDVADLSSIRNLAWDRIYAWNFKDVTDIIKALPNPNGEYKVSGRYIEPRSSHGSSAGWVLFVVYEDPDPSVIARKIHIYDGFRSISNGQININILGFQTIPRGPVKARLGAVSLEGDRSGEGDRFLIKDTSGTFVELGADHCGNPTNCPNQKDNFFDSNVTIDGNIVTSRRPAHNNTIGWDVDIFQLPNPNNQILRNDQNEVTLQLKSTGDVYQLVATAFSVETIAPIIELEKNVKGEDASGNMVDFQGQGVAYGKELVYEMRFRNVGNDDARQGEFVDIFPANVDLLHIENIPAGVTLLSQEKVVIGGTERDKVTYSIDDNLLRKNTTTWSDYFRFRVRVVPDCRSLRDVCANEILNQAFIRYKTALDIDNLGANAQYQPDQGSYFTNDQNCSKEPTPTNFLFVDPSCNLTQEVFLCGTHTILSAGNGYATYAWTKQGDTTILGTGQTLSVTAEGTYIVTKTLHPQHLYCQNPLQETFVVRYDANQSENPLLGFALEKNHTKCGNDGKVFVQIPLCATDKLLDLSGKYPTGTTIKWHRFNGTRPADLPLTCPVAKTPANAGQWTELHTGASYSVSQPGQYAVEVVFPSTTAGVPPCNQYYYFQVHRSNYDYNADIVRNFLCGAQGTIQLSGIAGQNQQYKIVKGNQVLVDWTDVDDPTTPAVETSVEYTIPTPHTAGVYKTYVRQKMNDPDLQANVCEYEKTITFPTLRVEDLFNIETTNVLCTTHDRNTGKIRISTTAVMQPFTLVVKKGTQTITTYSDVLDTEQDNAINQILSTLPKGTYTIEVTIPNGVNVPCLRKEVTIEEVPELQIVSVGSDGVSCGAPDERKINIVVRGGELILSGNGQYGFLVYDGTTQIHANNVAFVEKARTDVTIGGQTFDQITYELTVTHPWGLNVTEKTYRVEVFDKNNCPAEREVLVKKIQPKYRLETLPADCDLTAGKIKFVLEDPALANQYNIKYSIRRNINGTWGNWETYQTSPEFTGLVTGDYQTRIEYSIGGILCYYPADIRQVPDANGQLVNPNPIPDDQKPIEVTIGDGGGPVRAFVGVIRLACENADALVRVANMSGGEPISATQPYLIRVNGGAWGTAREFTLPPGNHQIQVRGKNENCIITKHVRVEDPITPPTITPELQYDCEGNVSVTLHNNNTDYEYSYVQTGTPVWSTDPSYTFPNKFTTTTTLRVRYKERRSLNPNVLILEDFGQGDPLTSSPGMTTAYTCIDPRRECLSWNQYFVAGTRDLTRVRTCGWWRSDCTLPNDHTDPTNPASRYLAIDFGQLIPSGAIFYQKDVNDVIPNKPIEFEMYGYNLVRSRNCTRPVMIMEIVALHPDGSVVQENGQDKVLGRIQSLEIPTNAGNPDAWFRFSSDGTGVDRTVTPVSKVNPGTYEKLRIRVRTKYNTTSCNDFAFDDIYVYQEPEPCDSFVEVPIVVEADKAFDFDSNTAILKDVSCNAGNDGAYRIDIKNAGATFQYRVLKGNTQYLPTTGTYATTSTPRIDLQNLTHGAYRIEIKYDDHTPACNKRIDFTIQQPDELQVTPSQLATHFYLNCQETNRIVKLADLITPPQGGTPPYTYIVTKGGLQQAVDTQGNIILEVGVYTIEVQDTRSCNTATSRKTITFEVKQRMLPTVTLERMACATLTGTNIRANVTPHASNVGSQFTYYIKQNSPATTGYVVNNGNVFRNLSAGNYTIKVTDQYQCVVEQSIDVYDVLSATLQVQHKSKCNSVENNGSITITPVNGSGNFEYAFINRTGSPVTAEYQTSDTKVYPYSTTTEVVYVWVRDVTTGCTFSQREEVRGTPETLFQVRKTDPHCQGDLGVLAIEVQQGAPTYSLIVTDATGQEMSNHQHSNQTNFVVSSLPEGTYTIKLIDAHGCEVIQTETIQAPELNATIQDENQTPGACNPNPTDLGFSIHKTAGTLDTGYTLLYSKDGGATWQVSHQFLNIAAGTPVSPVIGRFPAGTTVDASGKPSNPIYCDKKLGQYITKMAGGVEIDYTAVTSTGGACASSYDVKVRMGGTTQYYDVAYALDTKDNATWYNATGDQVTRYEYTFQNLVPGRQYIVWARYKTDPASTEVCYSSTAIDLDRLHIPNNGLKVQANPIPMCDATTNVGGVQFVLSGGNSTTISWQLMKIDLTTGIETPVNTLTGTMPTQDAPKADHQPYDTANGKTIVINNIPLGNNELYYLKVTDPTGCVMASNSVRVVYIPTTPMNMQLLSATLHCEGHVMLIPNVTGGSGAGFRYVLKRGDDTTGTDVLRREIRSTNNATGVELRLDDFLPTYLATNPTNAILTMVVIDKLTSCVVSHHVIIDFAPKPTFRVEAENNCTLPYRIRIIPDTGANTIADYEYSIDGGIIYTSNNVIPVPVGFKKGQVRMRNKQTRCVGSIDPAQANDVVIFPAFVASARLTKEPEVCNGQATYTIQVQSGSKNYEYIVTPKSTGVAQAAVPFSSTLPQGNVTKEIGLDSAETYKIEVIDKDLQGACATKVFDNVKVAPTQPVVATSQMNPVTCHGLTNGEIIVKLEKALNQQEPYSAVMDTPPAGYTQTPYQTPTHFGWVFGNLPAGTYTINVTSKHNCQQVLTQEVEAPLVPLTANVLAIETDTDFTCDNPLGTNKVRLTLEAQGGTAPYKFSIDNGHTWFDQQSATEFKRTFTITDNGAQQTIHWKVKDSRDCPAIEGTHTIETRKKVLSPITLTQVTPMDCATGEVVELTITSNRPSTYVIDIENNPAFAPVTTTLAGAQVKVQVTLPKKAGIYVLRVTDQDTKCPYNTPAYVVAEVEKPVIEAVATPTCNPNVANEVKITLTIKGNIGTGYNYEISKNGIQKIQGTDAGDKVDIVFNDPIDPATGQYDVVVTMVDTHCPITTFTQVLQAENPINIEATIVKHVSYNCDAVPPRPNTDGIIALKNPVIGGWGPKYEYLLVKNGNNVGIWSENTRFENLESNATYQIRVKDSNGCEAISNTLQLDAPQQITTTAGIGTTPVSCFGASDGTISLTGLQGGSGNYSYTLIDKLTGLPITTSKDNMGVVGAVRFEGLFAGEYIIRVSDQLFECAKPFELGGKVDTPDLLRAVATIDAFPDCNTDGSISIEATGGEGNYVYQLVDANNIPVGTANTTGVFAISHSVAGSYKFVVTSGPCKTYTNTIAQNQVEPLSIAITQQITELKCSGDATGKIVAKATGGSRDASKPYVYTLVDATDTPVNGVPENMTGVFTNLMEGTYKVQVKQQGGACTPVVTAPVTIVANPTYTATPVKTDVRCNGKNDGTYTITTDITAVLLNGDNRQLEYAISPRLDRFQPVAGNTIQLTGLAPGVYTLILQDQNGCRPTILDSTGNPISQDIFEFTIVEPPVFNVNITPGSLIHEGCLGASDAEVKLNISGGRPFEDATGVLYYEYSLIGSTTGFQRYDPAVGITNLPAGDHTLWVRDENGCAPTEVTIPTIQKGADLQATYDLIYTCNGTNDISNRVTIKVNPKEIANVVYRLGAPDATPRNNPVFVFPAVAAGDPPQTYEIYVESDRKNHKKCLQKLVVQIEHKPQMTWGTPTITHILCNGDNTGSIVANVTGGSGHYQYAISPNEQQFGTAHTFENLTAGIYHVIVRDVEFNCMLRQSVKINEPDALNIINLTEKGITCSGKVEGKVSFNVVGGKKFASTPNLLHQYIYRVYSATNPAVVYTDVIEIEEPVGSPKKVQVIKLPPGRFKLEVEDANGCKKTRDIVIDNAPDLQPEEVRLHYTCGVIPQFGEAPSSSEKTTYEIWVRFKTINLDKDLIKYSLNGSPRKKFSRFESHNVAVIGQQAGVPLYLPDGKYEITLFYDDCASILGTHIIEIKNHQALTIQDVTSPTEMNKLQVQVSGGRAPYKVYFANPKHAQILDLTSVYNEVQEIDIQNGTGVALSTPYIIQRGDFGEDINGKHLKTIRVYVEDALGCGYYVDIKKSFYDIQIPNYFTPNKDGVNDLWYPRNIETYPNASIQIIDRYGRFLAKIKPGEGWDGLYKGKELPAGDYWYVIHMNEPDDDRVFKGNFTLYR